MSLKYTKGSRGKFRHGVPQPSGLPVAEVKWKTETQLVDNYSGKSVRCSVVYQIYCYMSSSRILNLSLQCINTNIITVVTYVRTETEAESDATYGLVLSVEFSLQIEPDSVSFF